MLKNIRKKTKNIPRPAISRLCKIYNLLDEMEERGQSYISSKEIGQRIGVGSHNIRKDISYLGEAGIIGSGYKIENLKKHIENKLGFPNERKACVIGLDGLGAAIINDKKLLMNSFQIVAGFDTNINKLETIKTTIPVYPTYEISEIVKSKNIELAVITLNGQVVHEIAQRLIEGGIKGIVNFSPVILSSSLEDVYISNIDLVSEFRFLSALFSLENSIN